MLSASHIMRYMQEWRCLYRYSQQGWEALNALLKAYFFRRTNRGGLAKNSARKSKLLGIARWLQRRIMWYSGNGDTIFNIDHCNHHPDGNDVDADDNVFSTGSGDSYASATMDKDDSLIDSDDEMSIITAAEDDHDSDV